MAHKRQWRLVRLARLLVAAAVVSTPRAALARLELDQGKFNKMDGIDVTEPFFMSKFDVGDKVPITWTSTAAVLGACKNPATSTTPYGSCCEKVTLTLFKTIDGGLSSEPTKGKFAVGDPDRYGESLVRVKVIYSDETNQYPTKSLLWPADITTFDNYSIQVNCTVPFWSNYSGFSPYFQIYGAPTRAPSPVPTLLPSLAPSLAPSAAPTLEPSPLPTDTRYPSPLPTAPTFKPTGRPSPSPTFAPFWSFSTWGMIAFEVSGDASRSFNSNQLMATKESIDYFSTAVLSTSEIINDKWDEKVAGSSDLVTFIFTFRVPDLYDHGFNRTDSHALAKAFAEEEVEKLCTDLRAAFSSGNFTWYWRRKASDYGESLNTMKDIDVANSQSNSFLSPMANRISLDFTRYVRPTPAPTPLPTANPTTLAPTSTVSPTLAPTWPRMRDPLVITRRSALVIGVLFGGIIFAICALAFAHLGVSGARLKKSVDFRCCLQEEVPEWKDNNEYPQENNIFALKSKNNLDNVAPEPCWLTPEQEQAPFRTADPWFRARDNYDRDPVELGQDGLSVSSIGNTTQNIHQHDLSNIRLGAGYHLRDGVPLGGANGEGPNDPSINDE